MARAEKVQKVNELKERIRGSEALFVTDYRGLSVAEATELRRALGGSGARFTVTKNTLMKRAAGEAGIEGFDELLDGPTAVAFVDGDPIAAAKSLSEAIRRFRTLEVRGGYMEGRVLSSAEAAALATIEPREVLLSKLAGAMKAELAGAASMFQAVQGRFLSVLEAYREKLPAAEAADASASAEEQTEPEPAPADESPTEPEPTPAAGDDDTEAADSDEGQDHNQDEEGKE